MKKQPGKTTFQEIADKYPLGFFSGDLSLKEKAAARKVARRSIENGVHPDVAGDFASFGVVLKPVDPEVEQKK
ncbi:MAG: hypothetical protein ABIE14_04445 [Patescibacteria group bacterium]